MAADHRPRRVLWPSNGLSRGEGLVVGWRIDDTIVVVGLVEQWLRQHGSQELDLEVVGSCGLNDPTGEEKGLRFELRRGEPIRSFPPARIVLYDPPDPNRLRYLNLHGRSSDLTPPAVSTASQDEYGIGARKRQCVGLERVVPLLNNAKAAQRKLRDGTRSQPTTIPSSSLSLHFHRWMTVALAPLAYALRLIVGASHVRPLGSSWESVAVYSSFCNQLALRSQQMLDTPSNFRNSLHQPDIPLHIRSGRYVKFWNTIWLVMNDLVLGYCASELLSQAAPWIGQAIPLFFERYTIQSVVAALKWLDDWPVGLKLNTPLSLFFRTTFTAGVTAWGSTAGPLLSAHLPLLLRVASFSGLGGSTILLALLTDFIALLTLHLRVYYEITATLVRWQLSSLGGLWNLFRGKKWNVLRRRTDSYAYDVDQLFLGTLLFTVSAFLFPTVLAYAALFAVVRSGLWMVDRILALAIEGLNAFPLFEVLLRLKESSRLPDGVLFKQRSTRDGSNDGEDEIVMLEIKNSPRSMSSILLGRQTTI